MIARHTLALGAMAFLLAASPDVQAQESAPSYQADPDVYKVLFENENFRVISALRKAGQHDKPHAHPLPSVIYFVTDCKDRLYGPDGKSQVSERKAGTVVAAPIVKSHSTENIGTADCQQIFVERK